MTPWLATIVAALLVPTLAGVLTIVIQMTQSSEKLKAIDGRFDAVNEKFESLTKTVGDLHTYSHALYHDSLGPMVQDHELRLALIESHLKIGREE